MIDREKIDLIFTYVDDAYTVPTYLEDRVKKAIGQAIKVIEIKEEQTNVCSRI